VTVSARFALPRVQAEILDPDEARRLERSLDTPTGPDVWVYRYHEPDAGWTLSVATLAPPGSERLSLGGFRIAPESRTSIPGYDNDREAIELAVGMDEKVYWSRVLRVGGPLGLRRVGRIVGGKCVLRPTPDARVGQPRDRELLDFAVACLRDANAAGGMHIVTGQDLGHGLLSDGATSSLAYMHDRFEGSMLADTSRPTGEGNFHLLRGMLAGAGVPLERARIALLGAGNIGRFLLARLRESGVARIVALEPSAETRAWLAEQGVEAWPVERKLELLAQPLDAIVVNASGGSLDAAAVKAIAANGAVRVVCGSENLAMPNASDERVLLAAGKVYCHPELGGMMGYLTAVEEYLTRREAKPFDVDVLLGAAKRLHDVGYEATVRVVAGRYRETFQQAVRAIYDG
jgi:hypothetical protein